MKVNDLFFELSHEGRYKLLISIFNAKKKHTELEKESNLTGPEISRHLKRLQDEKLIEKIVSGYYQITPFGRMICSAIPFFENSLNFVDFINSHDFNIIPMEILVNIGYLHNIELKTTTMENIELWGNLIKDSNEYIYAITDQIPSSIIPIIQSKLKILSDLDIKAILEKKMFKKYTQAENLPEDYLDLLKQVDLFNKVRILETVNISMISADKGAIIFLRSGNHIDYGQGIYSTSQRFRKWSAKLFKMIWDRSLKINPSDLRPDK